MSIKKELADEMEITRQNFHHLLDSISEDFYSHPSDNPAWTIGEVLFHISLAPRFLTADLRMILGQAWISKLIGLFVPKFIFDKLNEYFTKRWASRNMTREKLGRAYEKAHNNAMQALESLQEEDFRKSLEYPNYDELLTGVVSVEKLYRYITIHFNVHAEQIREVIKETPMNKQALIEFTQRLVQQQSLSGEEGPVNQIVVDEMKSLGFDKVWVDENGSVTGVIEGTTPGKTILFDAHTDTVGIAPGSVWIKDPFGGEIIDGYLYGRGAADMKGALAAMIHAGASIDRSKLAGRVVISASVLEEVYEGGALKTVMDEINPDYVVIGESSNLNLVHGGRGRAEIHLETIGKPSHSSSPQFGINAIHLMMKVIEQVEKIKLNEHPLLGPAILALTDIISEPYPGYSVIPSRCKATYDRRLLTGETIEDVLGAITSIPELKDIPFNAVIAQGEHQAYTGAMLTCTKFFPAWELEAEHPFVQSALAGLRESGLDPQLSAYRFCTNAAYSVGTAGVPTIGFGPGKEADAHVVDERLSLDELEKVASGYRGIIHAVIGAEK